MTRAPARTSTLGLAIKSPKVLSAVNFASVGQKIALAESQHAPRAPTGTRSRAVGAAKWKSGIAAFIALSTEESACGGCG
jgi:hypothetical protein